MRLILFLFFFLPFYCTVAQQRDSSRNQKFIDRVKEKELTEKAIRSIIRKPEADTVFNFKSEDTFMAFEGKIIRHITIQPVHFTTTIQDTTKIFRSGITRIGEALHTDTREQYIRHNMFIKEGDVLNPFRLADNERYLRDLNFIKDSRIYIIHADEESDSVDLLVMTRDVFSIGVSLDPSSPTAANWLLQEANLLGTGLRLAYTGLYESDRRPQFGSEYSVRQNSIGGSFVDGTLGYTTINNARSLGNENETATYLRLDRPLFMPYARWAGGIEFSRNWSKNAFVKPDSLFANYIYSIQDYWAGITFGEKRDLRIGRENRNRKFLSARVLDQHFIRTPGIVLSTRDQLLHTNRLLALFQLTLFKQNFYKTKYVFGFGRTEDVPYGYSISLTTGWERQAGIERPYWGGEITKSFTNQGNIISVEAQGGGYFRNGDTEDIKISLTGSYFSKAYDLKKFKIRHSIELGLSKFYDRNIKSQLDINDFNGIQGFKPDSLFGNTRLRTRVQAIVFTNWKLIGFNFAVVPQIDLAFLSNRSQSTSGGRFFQGFSLGLRTRNENLIFNTIELRSFFYPTTVESLNHFRININASIRIKYPTTLVRAPETIFDL